MGIIVLGYRYIFLIFVLFFYFNGGVPGFRDGSHFYRPLFFYICDELNFGRFPFWDPYENLGQPLAGNPTSLCFYPLTILAISATRFGLNYDYAYSFFVAFHILFAGFTCYRFILVNRFSGGSAVFGGLSYSLGGVVIFNWNNLPFLIGAAWLPEVLRQAKIILDKNYSSCNLDVAVVAAANLTADKLDKLSYKNSKNIHINIIGLAISLAMIILGGDPQLAYNVIICIVIIIFFSFKYNFLQQLAFEIRQCKSVKVCILVFLRAAVNCKFMFMFKRFQTFVYFFFAGILAFMFAAVQILPAIEFWQLSDRTLVEHAVSIDRFSFHPLRIFEFLFTGISGKLFPVNAGLSAAILNEKNPWTPSVYAGLLPALFALCAVISCGVVSFNAIRRRLFGVKNRYKTSIAIFVILIIFLLASFGNNFFVYRLLQKLPVYDSFRYPSKTLVLAALALSFFAAAGFDTFRLNKRFANFVVIMMRIIVTIYLAFTILICCYGCPTIASHPLFGEFDGNLAKSNQIKSIIIVTIIWILLECIYRYNFIAGCNKLRLCFMRSITGWSLVIILTVDLFISNSWLMISSPFGNNIIKSALLQIIETDNRLNVTKILSDKNNEDGLNVTKIHSDKKNKDGLNVTEIHSDKNNKRFAQNDKQNDKQNHSIHHSFQLPPVRIYREYGLGYPLCFLRESSSNRFEEIINWEELTLYPRYSLALRVGAVNVRGTMMQKDYYLAMTQIATECKTAIKKTEKQNGAGLFERHLEQLGVKYIIAKRDYFDANSDFNADKIIIDSKNHGGDVSKYLDNISIWKLRNPATHNYILYEPNRIVFDVEISGQSETIILAEQYWPGWRAFDGDVEIPVKVARKIFRAVELKEGKHRIIMIYDPPLIKIGSLITIAAIIITIGVIYCLSLKFSVFGRQVLTL
ncbi:MAG: YfhO family protein [Planctomycetaceae bacterium]|nr:YfhO family protein [Planctomycetaceae bacterium]